MPSIFEIHEILCAPGQFFEMETVPIRGVPTRTWKNAVSNLAGVLDRGVSDEADADFIVLGEERMSHGRHHELVEAVSSSLVDNFGIRKGDRVAIAMRNLPEWSITFFAATRIGAVAVPLNSFGNSEELAYTLVDSDAALVVADGERLERLAAEPEALRGRHVVATRVEERRGSGSIPSNFVPFDSLANGSNGGAPVRVEPDDLATIFYTSGTTSRPKGVVGTHRNICTSLMSMMFHGARTSLRDGVATPEGPADSQVALLTVPLFHATGCHGILLRTAFLGGTVVLMRKWDPEVALDLIERERVTGFSGVPAMLWDVLNSPSLGERDLSSIRNFGAGGAASPPELLRRIKTGFPDAPFGTGYGLTESSSATASIGGTDFVVRPDSVGIPFPVCDVRLVQPDGRDALVGEAGEIWIKGPNVVPGYWNQPELTLETFTDGFLHTGDIGRLDEEGFLYIVDRVKDIVIRGGENISTLEVESVLQEHPAVLEVAVFSVPHRVLGEEVGAAVYLRGTATVTSDELRSHVAAALASHKVPTHIWFSGKPFPRGSTGKLLKRHVQATYTRELGQPPIAQLGDTSNEVPDDERC
jgi:long-chain acyl-CoA synthetase